MTKFKDGDEIIITGHHFNDGTEVGGLQRIIGKKGTIVSAEGVYLTVNIEDEDSAFGILASDMKLAKEAIKVGDKVRIKDNADRSAFGPTHRGQTFTVKTLDDHGNPNDQYCTVEEVSSMGGLWLSEVERVEEQPTVDTVPHGTVEKQTHIKVKEGNIAVAHVTNSKRNRVSILKTGTAVGHIKFDDIDTLISLLTRLKEEV